MAVLPGSLDYLYYNGILDHIPYEVYGTTPSSQSMQSANAMNSINSINAINSMNSMNSMNNVNSSANGNQYFNSAIRGNFYNSYNSSSDIFVKESGRKIQQGQDFSLKENAYGTGISSGYGYDNDFEVVANGQDGKSFRQSVTSAARNTADKFMNAPTVIKGIISTGIIAGTVFLLLRGKKKVLQSSKPSFSFKNLLNKIKFWK